MKFPVEAENVYRFHPEGRSGPSGSNKRPVLQDLSLRVKHGTLTVVMGPSGSGKSTLLHILSGLDLPSAGIARLTEVDLTSCSEEERTRLRRQHVGFVFQFFNLVPNLTVGENIALPLALEGVKKPRRDPRFIATVMEFKLGDKLERLPHELSGGEMQRTSIARALVHRPQIILADEPTGNLASREGREVMEYLVRAVREMGQTVLLVTHNPRDASYGNEVHFLTDGRLVPELALTGKNVDEDRILACLEKLSV